MVNISPEIHSILSTHSFSLIVIQECMQMSGWQTLMRSAILCSRAEYFTDQHHTSRQVPLGEWFVFSSIIIRFCRKKTPMVNLGMEKHVK